MVSKWLGTEREDNDSLDSDLSDWIKSFGSEEFPEFHSESGRKGFFIRPLIGGVEPDSVLNKEITFFLRLGEFDKISWWI